MGGDDDADGPLTPVTVTIGEAGPDMAAVGPRLAYHKGEGHTMLQQKTTAENLVAAAAATIGTPSELHQILVRFVYRCAHVRFVYRMLYRSWLYSHMWQCPLVMHAWAHTT
jgi:hypothetical protein